MDDSARGAFAAPNRILCVSNDEARREANAAALRGAGFEVVEASSGSEALMLAGKERPSAVLVGVPLPDLDGLEFEMRLKSDPRTAGVRVIAMEERGGPEDAAAAVAASIRAGRLERRHEAEILESIADPVVAFDMQWRLTYASRSAARVLGKTPEQLIGRPLGELSPALATPEFQSACRRAWADGTPATIEHHSPACGEWIEVCIYPFQDGASLQCRSIAGRKRAEEALRESQERNRFLGDLLERADQPFGIGHPDGRIAFVNSAFERLTGYSREELRSLTWNSTLTPPELREAEAAKLEELRRTGRPVRYENECVRKDGTRVPIELLVHPATDDHGAPIYASLLTDLTERKQAEKALRESEERFRNLVEITAQMVWIANAQGELESDSPSWRAFTGAGREELRGWGWLEAVHPDDRERVAGAWREAVANAAAYRTEYRLRHDSGEYRYVLSQAVPLFAADGGVREWIGMSADITDWKRAEQALAEALQRLNAHMDNSPLAVVEFDRQFRIARWSKEAERVFGWTAEEMLGRSMTEVRWIHEEDVESVRRASGDMLAGKRPRNVNVNRNYRKDGSIVECEWYNSAIYDKDGDLASIMSQVLDITERKRNEERLRQAQKLESIGLLAGGIAHDFNNLLTGVMGNASMVLDEVGPGPARRIQGVLDAAERAANLTRQLLAYSGKGQFVIEDIDVSRAVNSMAELLQSAVPRSIELAINLQRRLPLVRMDPGQLQQVLMNLVLNAGEAIGEGNAGRIAVTICLKDVAEPFTDALGEEVAAGRYVSIEVKDTGAGMDESTRPRIFDPFFTTKFTGRGLGLAAVAGIVRSQKGGITVESAPGSGSTFRVLLPPAGGLRGSAEHADAEPRATIVLVDDEASVRDFIAAALRREGYRALVACDGREALAICERERCGIDAVIVDIVMPVMGANEALPALKALCPDAGILLTSGYSESEARRLCGDYPGTAFLQKPYTARRILRAIEDVLGGGRAAAAESQD